MKLYRIYTEEKNLERVCARVTGYYQAFTILHGEGYWNNTKEKSLIIEILTEDSPHRLESLCKEIKLLNEQECVLLTIQELRAEFV